MTQIDHQFIHLDPVPETRKTLSRCSLEHLQTYLFELAVECYRLGLLKTEDYERLGAAFERAIQTSMERAA